MRAGRIAAAMVITLFCAPAQAFAQSDPVAAPPPAVQPAQPAQTAEPAPPPAPVATAAPSTAVPAGSVVDIEITEVISSKIVKIGDKFTIRLAYPILKDGKVVVPSGTTGMGQVIDAAPAGALGKPAKLLLAARYLDFNGAQIKLRTFQLGRVGVDNSGAIMAMSFIPYVGLASMFMRGGEIEVPIGTRGQAKLVADLDPSAVRADSSTPDPRTSSEGPGQP